MSSNVAGRICLKMKSDIHVTTAWLIWPSSMFDNNRNDHEKDLGWEYDTDGFRLVRWSMIIMNTMFLMIMQRWVWYIWLLPFSMFDDNNGKVSMIQVALALFDVRPHEWSHMRSPPPTSSHLIIFILMISIIPIHRFIVMSSFQITQCETLSL